MGPWLFFGALVDLENHAHCAVTAALSFQLAMQELNRKNTFFGTPLETGIGINTCTAVVGNLGSRSRMNYTAIGEGVNLAARIEQLTKHYKTPVLVSESSKQAADGYLIGKWIFRLSAGWKKPARLFQPLGLVGQLPADQLSDLSMYSEGLEAFRRRNWNDAERVFSELAERSGDNLTALYLDACRRFRENEPGDDWIGHLLA